MLKMLGKNILVRIDPVQEKSKGGIILAESAIERPIEGTVVCVGRDVAEVKAKDRVMYGKYAGTEIVLTGGEELLVLNEEDVIGVVS